MTSLKFHWMSIAFPELQWFMESLWLSESFNVNDVKESNCLLSCCHGKQMTVITLKIAVIWNCIFESKIHLGNSWISKLTFQENISKYLQFHDKSQVFIGSYELPINFKFTWKAKAFMTSIQAKAFMTSIQAKAFMTSIQANCFLSTSMVCIFAKNNRKSKWVMDCFHCKFQSNIKSDKAKAFK